MDDRPARMAECVRPYIDTQRAIQDWLFPDLGGSGGASEGNVEEAAHVRTVAGLMSVLAPVRGLNPNLAELIGWLHDAGRLMPGGQLTGHAACGAAAADGFLTAQSSLSLWDRQRIVEAIRHHSSKKKLHGAYDELLKDADAYQRFLEGAPVLQKGSWIRRVQRVHQELSAILEKALPTLPGQRLEPSTLLTAYIGFVLNVAFWAGTRCRTPLDEAAIHENRVYLRQAKAVLGVFKPLIKPKAYQKVQKGLSEILHTFEPVRTLQVEKQALEMFRDAVILRESTEDPMIKDMSWSREAGDSGEALMNWCEVQLSHISKALEEALDVLSRMDWTTKLAEWTWQAGRVPFRSAAVSNSLEKTAHKRLFKAIKLWVLQYGVLCVQDSDWVHRSRLEVKKIRYLLRTVQALPFCEPESTKVLLHALSIYQEISGQLHDAVLSQQGARAWSWVSADVAQPQDQGIPKALLVYQSFREAQSDLMRKQLQEEHSKVMEAMALWRQKNPKRSRDQEKVLEGHE